MHVLTIIGNRPQFVKLAAVSPLLRREHRETLVHTGQHHDRELSGIFFEELALPEPDIELGISGGSNSSQTARMLDALGPLIASSAPDAVLVYGDTNTTLAGSLAAAQSGVPSIHVEAGLRSFDRTMPEEINRVVSDALAGLLLVPSESAALNLEREGVAGRVVLTGDVMGDIVVKLGRSAAGDRGPLERFNLVSDGYLLLTAHRVANVDDGDRLCALVDLVESLELPVVFPVHPRTRARLIENGLWARLQARPKLILTGPLGYSETLTLVANAYAVLTDSGGLQKEACWLGTRCLTLRDRTEWIETLTDGWNTLVDLDPALVATALSTRPGGDQSRGLYRAGDAGRAVVAAITTLADPMPSPVESA